MKNPTVTVDMNEASILALIAKLYIYDYKKELNEVQENNWKKLINKLEGK